MMSTRILPVMNCLYLTHQTDFAGVFSLDCVVFLDLFCSAGFYRASTCEGGLGSRNSVRLSVTRVDCDKTK